MSPRYSALTTRLSAMHEALVHHRVYKTLDDRRALARFMEGHVFAVWDFMSLLKTLQRRLTCTSVPWTPPANRLAARLVNEIVLAEESDEIAPGVYTSHFELYLEAMQEVGADVRPVQAFVAALAHITDERERANATKMALASLPEVPRAFVETTLALAEEDTVAVAAAFLVGRERLVPAMFETMLRAVGHAPKLKLYLERHVELDGETHGPMAERLLVSLAGEGADDEAAWQSAERAAVRSLEARKRLWDGLSAAFDGPRRNLPASPSALAP